LTEPAPYLHPNHTDGMDRWQHLTDSHHAQLLGVEAAVVDTLIASWPTMPETDRDTLMTQTWLALDRDNDRQRGIEEHLAALRQTRRLRIWSLLVMGVNFTEIARRLHVTRMAVVFTAYQGPGARQDHPL
jgi:hypothetical protein